MTAVKYTEPVYRSFYPSAGPRRFPPKDIGNTFEAISGTFGSLQMHSKWSYIICICSVILGELEYFRNYKGFSFKLPKHFRYKRVEICT